MSCFETKDDFYWLPFFSDDRIIAGPRSRSFGSFNFKLLSWKKLSKNLKKAAVWTKVSRRRVGCALRRAVYLHFLELLSGTEKSSDSPDSSLFINQQTIHLLIYHRCDSFWTIKSPPVHNCKTATARAMPHKPFSGISLYYLHFKILREDSLLRSAAELPEEDPKDPPIIGPLIGGPSW